MNKNNDVIFTELVDLLAETLEGTEHDIEDLKKSLPEGVPFDQLDIDSLDLTEYFLRVEERFGVTIGQRDYAGLRSIEALRQYLRTVKE